MPNRQSPQKEARQRHKAANASTVSEEEEEKADKEYAATGAHATDDPIAELLNEGRTPLNEHHGELRTDQSAGHRGGDRRQKLNRGRD